jgi:CheY-like chemotaxis protein
MNAILGFISLLKEKPLDAEAREYLQTIDNASQSLLGIINDILDLSKIESGHLRIDPSEFDPHKEFNVTADLFKARSSEKNIYFELTLPKQLPPGLKTDVLRLKQVLNNLLSNAVKFTEPNHRIQLQIDYQENDPKNHQAWLHFNVTDEGIGMTPEQLEKVFEAFTQAESHTTRQYGGTGLGLTISARLVEMLGGQLKATSTPGRGSCFYFAIPVEKVARPIETPKDDSQAPSLRGHVLLVEDNQTNQLLMSAILKKIGLTLDIASDGFEAIECVQKHDYDLVLMDENMPNLNGIEATREIRQLGTRYETLPIIALTANAMTGDRERFLAAGMDEYLSKPVNLSKLIEVVQPFLSAPQARKE